MQLIQSCKSELIKIRNKRIKPRLDDKILSSWNGLMIKGFADSYKAFNEPDFLDAAVKNGEFILTFLKPQTWFIGILVAGSIIGLIKFCWGICIITGLEWLQSNTAE